MSESDKAAELDEISNRFTEAMDALKKRSEEKWNALSKVDQLDYFCAVVRRIHQGEIETKRTYRGVLYGTFEFGPEAYAQAQMSGYLDLHNCIVSPEEERRLLCAFAKDVGIENPDEAVHKFYGRTM